MGRPRKPTSVLKATGSYRKDRHGSSLELPPELPKCPRKLKPGAQKYWKALCEMLEPTGMLAAVDAEALSRFCALADEFDRARSVDRLLKLTAALDRLGQQFGLTPAARTKVSGRVSAPKPAKPAAPPATPILRIAQ